MNIAFLKNRKAGDNDRHPADSTPLVAIESVASTDGLTGLLTKQGLFSVTAKVLSRNGRPAHDFAVISLDMDFFKQINDTVGHEAGDLVLQEVARRIRSAVRREDLVARTGGDEFVVVMTGTVSEVTILNIADRVLNAVAKPVANDALQLYPSLTVGIAIADENECSTFEETLHRSDLALQQAKLICRGTIHFFDRNMAGELDQQRQLENDLRKAVRRDELRLHYQPIYDIQNSVISHVEALVRWQHPTLGLVPPGDFIPVAETSGLIQAIGVWVLSQAFQDLPALEAADLGRVGMTVNLSPEQLKHTAIVKTIEEIAAAHPEHHGKISLEVTEDAVVDERYQMTAKLQQLRSAGFRILLDDFGTGNASIGRLRKFSFDSIKIDRSLISNIEHNEADLAIVRAILLLADSMGVTVIAEGVETRECRDVLAREGCRYAQGYYFSRPLPLPETIDIIHQRREMSALAQAIGPV